MTKTHITDSKIQGATMKFITFYFPAFLFIFSLSFIQINPMERTAIAKAALLEPALSRNPGLVKEILCAANPETELPDTISHLQNVHQSLQKMISDDEPSKDALTIFHYLIITYESSLTGCCRSSVSEEDIIMLETAEDTEAIELWATTLLRKVAAGDYTPHGALDKCIKAFGLLVRIATPIAIIKNIKLHLKKTFVLS
jgi:hypothetical protein